MDANVGGMSARVYEPDYDYRRTNSTLMSVETALCLFDEHKGRPATS